MKHSQSIRDGYFPDGLYHYRRNSSRATQILSARPRPRPRLCIFNLDYEDEEEDDLVCGFAALGSIPSGEYGPAPQGPLPARHLVSGAGLVLVAAVFAVLTAIALTYESASYVALVAGVGLAGLLAPGRIGDAFESMQGKHTGLPVEVVGLGKVELTRVLAQNSETTIYHTAHPGIVVKMFDLNCGKADEISYGPYMSFGLETANWEDIRNLEELRHFVPAYYGASINYERKYAFIAMEYLEGDNLKSWCEQGAAADYQEAWIEQFKEAVYEALSIVARFHRHGIILIDFKPDNIIRLTERAIKFVDLGAFFTPRHYGAIEKYVYSATPDYAELLIDALNVQSGLPPAEASDIFATGVALFEMATGSSRLEISGDTANEILGDSAIFRFRDSQIRDLWRSYPHLKEVFPLLETQLRERHILFAELWHLLKGYLASKLPDWEALPTDQRDQIILATGTTFIMEQLPSGLQWLAGPIAQATVLRSIRLKSVAELMRLMAHPVSGEVQEDVDRHNCFVQYLRDLQVSVAFVKDLSTWDVKWNEKTRHWTIAAPTACLQLLENAQFTFLKQSQSEDQGHRFFHVVSDHEADSFGEEKLSLWRLRNDHFAWLS